MMSDFFKSLVIQGTQYLPNEQFDLEVTALDLNSVGVHSNIGRETPCILAEVSRGFSQPLQLNARKVLLLGHEKFLSNSSFISLN
jgi:hypothetical protein